MAVTIKFIPDDYLAPVQSDPILAAAVRAAAEMAALDGLEGGALAQASLLALHPYPDLFYRVLIRAEDEARGHGLIARCVHPAVAERLRGMGGGLDLGDMDPDLIERLFQRHWWREADRLTHDPGTGEPL